MAAVVIPDFTAQTRPRIEDVQAAELSIMEALGGSHEGVPLPGALGLDNLVATPGFVAEQVRETRSRIVLATGRWNNLYLENPNAGESAYLVAPVDLDLDVVTLVHCAVQDVIGKIAVFLDGVALTDLIVSEKVACGVPFEFQFRYFVRAGGTLRFHWKDGTNLLKEESTGLTIPATAWVTAQAWGVARHRA